MSEGHPKIIQSDRGGEFKKRLTAYCQKQGIRQIMSRPYHPQTQGKVERSHRAWKDKFMFDVRRSNYKFTNWVSRIQSYASIYNRQHHDALGTSPFHVYHGRQPQRMGETSVCRPSTCPDVVTVTLQQSAAIRASAKVHSDNSAKKMVTKYGLKHIPSQYSRGETVFVKKSKGHKISSGHIYEGVVMKANYRTHMYKVKYAGGVGWFSVSQIAAKTRQLELAKRGTYRKRILLKCQCDSSTCDVFADTKCTNCMCRSCCKASLSSCGMLTHAKRTVSLSDFVKPANDVTEFIKFIDAISSIADSDNTHDSLIANALLVNLLPEGSIPRDGSCMFHAVAQSLTVSAGLIDQLSVRIRAAQWLRDHPVVSGNVQLPDFVYGTSWQQYLQGLETNDWGDHISLIGIANAFNVVIGIVSSETPGIRYIYPEDTSEQQHTIYLGHEFESHYIRLTPIDGCRSTVVEDGDIPAADDGRAPGDSANVGLTAPVETENGAINDTSWQVIDVTETASSHRPLFLCDLPDEMLEYIFGFVASSGGAAYIGAVRAAWSRSLRVTDVLARAWSPRVHINPDNFRRLEGSSHYFEKGVHCKHTICKLIRVSGKISGLALRLKEIFSCHPKWYSSTVVLAATGALGWFRVYDFIPPKGW